MGYLCWEGHGSRVTTQIPQRKLGGVPHGVLGWGPGLRSLFLGTGKGLPPTHWVFSLCPA